MPKPGKPTKPRADRGGRYCMVLELEPEDENQLNALVARYQKVLGAASRATKAFAIRQLIRDANTKKNLPPVRA